MEVVTGAVLDIDDLQAAPDDGRRWEILDGAFVVSPSPGSLHQLVVFRLAMLLGAAADGSGLQPFTAPFAWRIGPGQVPEPDLVVAEPTVITERAVEGPPALVVEVLSPSGRGRDLYEKRRIYAEGGADEYWIVDPDVPSITVLRLVGGVFDEVAVVTGDEAYEAETPFRVRVVPAQLVRPAGAS